MISKLAGLRIQHNAEQKKKEYNTIKDFLELRLKLLKQNNSLFLGYIEIVNHTSWKMVSLWYYEVIQF